MVSECKAFAVQLSAYFDGELEGSELQAVESHLVDCDACRNTLQRLDKLRNALHSLSRPTGRQSRSILDDLKARLADDQDGDAPPDDPQAS